MEPELRHSVIGAGPSASVPRKETSGVQGRRTLETEQEIIRRCLAGDMSAFRLLYETHKNVMYNVALRMLRNEQDAEDSVQEAFVQTFRSLARFRGESRLSTWIYKILMNTCLTRLRRAKPSAESLDGIENGGRNRLSAGNRDGTAKMILEQEIGNLPVGFRTVFVLHEVEGFSHDEIAKMLDITEGTSKSQLFKAKRVLQKRLRPFMEILEAY